MLIFLKILPNSKKAITLENIVVTDEDTDNEHIEVIIDTSPTRGNIIFKDDGLITTKLIKHQLIINFL